MNISNPSVLKFEILISKPEVEIWNLNLKSLSWKLGDANIKSLIERHEMKNLHPLVMKISDVNRKPLKEQSWMSQSLFYWKSFFFMASSEIIPFSIQYFFVEVFISTFPTQDFDPSCKGTLWQLCAEHFSPKNKFATIKFDQLASFHQGWSNLIKCDFWVKTQFSPSCQISFFSLKDLRSSSQSFGFKDFGSSHQNFLLQDLRCSSQIFLLQDLRCSSHIFLLEDLRCSSQIFLLKDVRLRSPISYLRFWFWKSQIFLLKDLRSSFFPTQGFEVKIAHFTTEGFVIFISNFPS